ncbi:hypothetical protein F5B20DRAFT_563368 [Whalleya microplaca]|nr:hypothetical protein F5B20DRAFT_563368 [Whalleya microplaca]
MFGTLRFTPKSNGVDFIERADGRSFSEMGNSVPPHSACTSCRSKKLRCGGQKPKCDRCKTSLLTCVYAPVEGSVGRRRSGQKRDNRGEVIHNSSSNARRTSCTANSEPEKPETAAAACIIVADSSSSTLSSSPSTSSIANDRLTPISCMSDPHSSSPHEISLDMTCLDPELLHPVPGTSLSSQSDTDFQFFDTGMPIVGTDKSMVNDMSIRTEMDIYSDTFSSVDFNTAALWSTPPSTGLMSPNISDTTSTLTPESFTSIIPNRYSLVPTSPSFKTQTETQSNTSSRCAGQCVHTITLLIEELEARMHAMEPRKLEAVLSWQKQACDKCSSMLRCKTCYADLEQMMLLMMVCDKLIMLSRKLLWHTMNTSTFDCSLLVGEYEVEESNEMLAIIRHLSIYRVRSIAKLVAEIKASPAVEGKHVQLMLLRNIEQQVVKTLKGVKESFAVLTE